MDRINVLSDEVICHILSFLPIKESALTCVLSTRWRNLFALTPNLHIEDDLEVGGGESFIDFVGRVLVVSGDLPIRKFSLKCRRNIDSGHVTRWMIDVLKRGGVVNLDMESTGHEDAILVPLEMFTCKTIVGLKLGTGFLALIPDYVSLPSLKTLVLDSISFYNRNTCVLGMLLSACPLLEELTICGVSWQIPECCRTVSSSTLRKLTMICIEKVEFWNLSLDTPNLAYLEYSDLVPREYPVVNLESLVEAKLDLWLQLPTSNPTNLIKGLRNVQALELSSFDTLEMLYLCRDAIPVFSNLLCLSIFTTALHYSSCNWGYLPILMKKSPNLQTLVIKGPLDVDKCEREYELPCPVKVLKITEYRGSSGELKQLKHFLEKLSFLELVQVRACAINDEENSRITKDLLMVPRSSKCDIQIKFCE